MPTPDDLPPDAVRRITEAADQLFEEAGRATPPNVDAVRRRAHANMNHVTLVMRSWRQQHASRAATAEDVVPEPLRQLGEQFVTRVWREARGIAEEQLGRAKAAWDIERAELEEVRDQLSMAFDQQTKELEHSNGLRADLQAQQARLSADQARLTAQLEAAEAERVAHQRVQAQALEEAVELRKLLQSALAGHERQTQQWQAQLSAHAEAAHRHHAEQALRSDELVQLKQETAALRAALHGDGNAMPSAAAPRGAGKRAATRRDAAPAIERKK